MRRTAILALALAAVAAGADLPKGEWKTARPVVRPALSAPGLVYLPLDEKALAVQSLSEYRVVRGGRLEVPYRMVVEQEQTETHAVPAGVVSRGRLGTEQAQVTLDLGSAAPPSNRIDLRLSGNNFRSRVRVEGSRDSRQWWLVTDKGIVFRHEGRFEQTRVSLPPQQYRFLRITLSRQQGQLPQVEQVQVMSEVTIPRRLVPVPAALSRREDAKPRSTVLDFNLGRPSRDLAQVRLAVAESTFDRPVTIEAVSEGNEFQWVGAGRLRRLAPDREVVLPLDLPRARRLRIVIANGDDRPLTIRAITLERVRRGLVFSADPAQTYELWYGRPNAAQPVYEMQRLPMVTPPAKLPLAALGEERALPVKPPPPPPWGERHRALFWVALAVVVALLAFLIVRAMQGARAAPPDAR